MKRVFVAALLAVVAGTVTAAESRLVIKNESLWDIHRIYISSTDSDEWGPDQLEDDILKTGQTLTLRGVDCDYYDIKLVDEDSDVCEIRNVKLCSDRVWTIESDDLLECQSNTRN